MGHWEESEEARERKMCHCTGSVVRLPFLKVKVSWQCKGKIDGLIVLGLQICIIRPDLCGARGPTQGYMHAKCYGEAQVSTRQLKVSALGTFVEK